MTVEEPGAWKWDDDLDTDLVCLFRSLDDARAFASEYITDPVILKVETDEEIHLIVNDEGYDAVVGSIPARCLSRV